MVAHRNHETCCSIAILEYSGTYSRTYCDIAIIVYCNTHCRDRKKKPAAEILLIRAEMFFLSPLDQRVSTVVAQVNKCLKGMTAE